MKLGENKPKVSILHDFMLVSGGAEKLVFTLAKALHAELIVGFVNPVFFLPKSYENIKIKDLGRFLNNKFARYVINAWRFYRIDSEIINHEITIYSGILSVLAVHRQSTGRKIYYCHSPPRFLYDLNKYYKLRTGFVGRAALFVLDILLRARYERAVKSMDLVVANSENVRQRLKRYLNVESIVVHPPIDTARYSWIETGDYFLSLARLENYKRVDVIIEAFKNMPDKKLVVASGGSEETALRKMAEDYPNISFTSWMAGDAFADLIGRCRAVIYIPINEDFGMSPLEAMAAGKPVIGVSEGGLLETIKDGQQGILLPVGFDFKNICAATDELTKEKCESMKDDCLKQAERFSNDVFVEKIRSQIGFAIPPVESVR